MGNMAAITIYKDVNYASFSGGQGVLRVLISSIFSTDAPPGFLYPPK